MNGLNTIANLHFDLNMQGFLINLTLVPVYQFLDRQLN